MSKLAGLGFLVLTLGIVAVAIAWASYIGYFQYDTVQILVGCLINPSLSQAKIVRIASFLLKIHEAQMIVMVIRMFCLWLFHEALIRVFIMLGLLKKNLSLFRIKIFQEIRVVTSWLYTAESILVGLVLSFAFFFILFSACTLFVGIKRNNIAIAVPALGLTCVAVVIVQIIFIFGSLFYNLSNSLIIKWKKDASLWTPKHISKTYICKKVRSLQAISVPAGNIGIVDKDIKINYMDNLLQNIVSSVLTLKDLLQ